MKIEKKLASLCVAALLALSVGVAYAETTAPKSPKAAKTASPPIMKLYMDTHDKANGTFPASITSKQLNEFYGKFAKACSEEGVVIVRTYVSQKDGRAFCLNMATSIAAVKKAHDKAGLPYGSITEVNGVAPTDLLLNEK
jgi:hypothetical protein